MSSSMSPKEVAAELCKIEQMSHEEMARLQRFAPAGHKYFDLSGPFHAAFAARFKAFGGRTAEISKKIGL